MIIGHFDYDPATDRFKGDITCLSFQLLGVELSPGRGQSTRQPDYTVTLGTPRGQIDLGSAWKRKSERGMPYLSLSLDAPLFTQPIHLAMFMASEGDMAVLVWSRSRSLKEPALAAQ